MTSVGVVHLDLTSKGGGEAVALNVLESLQADYELTLLTAAEPDVPALNDYFNTRVDPSSLSVRLAGTLAPALHDHYADGYYVLQNALLARYVRRHADEFDLLVSTINELGLPRGSIEYVHFPFDWSVSLTNRGDIFHPTLDGDSVYERLCRRVAGVDRTAVQENSVFANSEWTESAFEDAYDVRPEVLYPPVDTTEFVERRWTDRENGFVVVGRIERSKRLSDIVEVIDGVRERGHDTHLHVVGPTYDEAYRAELDAMAAARDHVFVEGELPRSELVDLMCSHRYGVHGKANEHFGMSVAELVAAGAVTFVPESGGQCAIVHDDDRLTYRTFDEAAAKIDRVLGDRSLQRELRFGRSEIERRFGRRRFRDRIAAAAAEALGETREVTTRPARRLSRIAATDDLRSRGTVGPYRDRSKRENVRSQIIIEK